jgi:integrase/recombinase XerD
MGHAQPSAPFHRPLAACLEQCLQEKPACGSQYHEPTRLWRRLDDCLCQAGLTTAALPRSLVRTWVAKRAHESARTQRQRLIVVRQFSRFLVRPGSPAYVPDGTRAPREPARFVPSMLTHAERRQLLQAVDTREPTARSPLRHLMMPAVFRLLSGCGFRLGEVWHVRVRDVDLEQGSITVRQGQFRQDRLVPLAVSLGHRLRQYAARCAHRSPEALFFPAPQGGPCHLRTVYGVFRQRLLQCGMPHAGRGKGPRLHDMRHVFAVPTFLRW